MKTLDSESITMLKEQASSVAASAAATFSFGNGFLAFLNANAGLFSLGIGIISLIATIIFAYLGWKARVRANNLTEQKIKQEKLKADLEVKKLQAEIENLKKPQEVSCGPVPSNPDL